MSFFSRHRNLIIIGFIIVAMLSIKLYSLYWPKTEIILGPARLKVLVANNYKHWQKGLGGRRELKDYDGMLFLFPETTQHTMVMRDMQFSIDIIWIAKGKVVDIAPNVLPETGKNDAELTPYFARQDSSMVLEAPAGLVEKIGLKIGDELKLAE